MGPKSHTGTAILTFFLETMNLLNDRKILTINANFETCGLGSLIRFWSATRANFGLNISKQADQYLIQSIIECLNCPIVLSKFPDISIKISNVVKETWKNLIC